MINKRLKDVLFSDQWSELCMDTLSPFGYVLVSAELNLMDALRYEIQEADLLFVVPFRWRPSVCRECCFWSSLNSATFRSSEVCRQRARAQGLGDIGYVLRIEDFSLPLWDLSQCRHVWWVRVRRVVGALGRRDVERWRCVCSHLPCMPGCICQRVTFPCVLMSASTPPGCCWCSLLLFEVSAAAGCLALWFCDSGKNIPTLSLNTDTAETHRQFWF